MKKFKLFGSLIFIGILTGCGGGGGGTTADSSTTTTAYATGSIYQNATCCFDTNNDDSCTGEATRVLSSSDGSFILNGAANYTILCELNGATKHDVEGDTGVSITTNKKLRAPVGADDGTGTYIISSISTKIWDEMEQNSSITITQAKNNVAGQLGIPVNDLTKDFHRGTNLSATVKDKLQSESDNLISRMEDNGSMATARNYVGTMNLPEQIDPLAQ